MRNHRIKSGEIPAYITVNDGLDAQYKKAWNTAFKAVKILKTRFKNIKVRVAGSLLHRDRFHEGSDIDLVVPEFTMSDKMDAEKLMNCFFPLVIDIVPLRSMLSLKRAYFMERSVPVGS